MVYLPSLLWKPSAGPLLVAVVFLVAVWHTRMASSHATDSKLSAALLNWVSMFTQCWFFPFFFGSNSISVGYEKGYYEWKVTLEKCASKILLAVSKELMYLFKSIALFESCTSVRPASVEIATNWHRLLFQGFRSNAVVLLTWSALGFK